MRAFSFLGNGILVLLPVLFAGSTPVLAGPPFQTDDPQPNVHLHIIIPAAGIIPSNNASLAPAGTGPGAFGLGDIELGIKYRFVQETKHRPMIGTFVMFEIPTGNAAKGLGVGTTWYKLPLWAPKSFGPWTTHAGGGETLVKAPGLRKYPFAGWLVQRDFGKKWTVGTEAFYHGRQGLAAAQTRPATLVDVGGYYKIREDLGLYWTWGNKKAAGDKPDSQPTGIAFNGMAPRGFAGRT